MRFTRKDADQLADAMIKNPNVEFRLKTNAVIYREDVDNYNRGKDLFVGFKKLGSIPNWVDSEQGNRVLWNGVLATYLEDERFKKFRYKTHLSDYLYNKINRALKIIKGSVVKPSGYKPIDEKLKSPKHWEYRTREPIVLTTKVFNNNEVRVSTDYTNYVTASLDKKIEKDEILNLHEKVRKLAIDNPKVKIRGKGYKKKEYIENEYYKYEEAYRRHVELFYLIRELWEWKVKEDSIYKGTTDDEVLNELYIFSHEFSKLRHRNQPLGEMAGVKYNLEEDLKNIERIDENTVEVSVYL